MTAQLQRDPFARATLTRTTIAKPYRTSCAWCGSAPGKFAYRWLADSIRPPAPMRVPGFCSVSCWRAHVQ